MYFISWRLELLCKVFLSYYNIVFVLDCRRKVPLCFHIGFIILYMFRLS